jgi:hypothetical protein
MFDCLREWMDVPAKRFPYISTTGTGQKVFGQPVDFLCYPTGKVTTVTDKHGEQVVSNNQLYVPGELEYSEFDEVLFEGRVRPLKTISTFYRNGVPDVKVLYL